MATPAQTIANQSNAQFSTGPRTTEGKSRVSQNALRHGLTAKHLVIRDDEHDEFVALQDALATELRPQGAVEILTFRELVHAAWNLHRFRRIEVESSSPDNFADPQTIATLDRLTRYQARAQRAYYKAIGEIRILQTNRALRAFKLAEEDVPEVPAIADINHLTKQTQSEVTKEALELAIRMMECESSALVRNSRPKYLAKLAEIAPASPSSACHSPFEVPAAA